MNRCWFAERVSPWNHRTALATVWSSTPKCSAMAFMETPRARISTASAASRLYTGTGADQTRSTFNGSRPKVRMVSFRDQNS